MSDIAIAGVTKAFGTTQVLHGIDLKIERGEFVVFVGPSGCGKSTLLRMIAGLESVTAGAIFIGGRDVTDLAPRDRNVAMVFQDYALYPHLNVAENIGFGLKLRGVPQDRRDTEVKAAADMLQLGALLHRRPAALSGGQRQRVAMGRCLVRHPDAFLFDEPLSNLDAKLRGTMRAEIRRLHRAERVTSIYVTHDQVEAMTLADRIVCLDAGRIAQIGTPDELYRAPANRFVASFIGAPTMNFLDGVVRMRADQPGFELTDGTHIALPPTVHSTIADGQPAVLGLRPEHLTDQEAARRPQFPATLQARVDYAEPLGADTLVYCSIGGQSVVARCTPSRTEEGMPLTLIADTANAMLFDPTSGAAVPLH